MSPSDRGRRLASLARGTRGRVVLVTRENGDRADRLAALGVTPGTSITVLQRYPSVVFLCDQTELAVEPAVAESILIDTD